MAISWFKQLRAKSRRFRAGCEFAKLASLLFLFCLFVALPFLIVTSPMINNMRERIGQSYNYLQFVDRYDSRPLKVYYAPSPQCAVYVMESTSKVLRERVVLLKYMHNQTPLVAELLRSSRLAYAQTEWQSDELLRMKYIFESGTSSSGVGGADARDLQLIPFALEVEHSFLGPIRVVSTLNSIDRSAILCESAVVGQDSTLFRVFVGPVMPYSDVTISGFLDSGYPVDLEEVFAILAFKPSLDWIDSQKLLIALECSSEQPLRRDAVLAQPHWPSNREISVVLKMGNE